MLKVFMLILYFFPMGHKTFDKQEFANIEYCQEARERLLKVKTNLRIEIYCVGDYGEKT